MENSQTSQTSQTTKSKTTRFNTLRIKTILKTPNLQPILNEIIQTVNDSINENSLHKDINLNASAYILRVLMSMTPKDTDKDSNKFSLYGTNIHSFKQYKPVYFPNISNVLNRIIVRIDKSFHRDSSVTGTYNGYTQTYELTELGKSLMRIISPVDNFDKLELLTREVAHQNIMIKREDYNIFKKAISNKIRNLVILGRYRDCVVIENTSYSNKFNRDYTTFSCMPSAAKELTQLNEILDCTKFAVRTVSQTWEYNFGHKLKDNDIEMTRNYHSLKKDHPKLNEFISNNVMYDMYASNLLRGSSCEFRFSMPVKKLKLVLTAISNGCRNYKQMIIDNLNELDDYKKNTFNKYFEESSLFTIIQSLITIRKRLLDELTFSKAILKLIGNIKGTKSIIARFCSFLEKKFRIISEVVLKKYSNISCHDAIFTYCKIPMSVIERIPLVFKHVTQFNLDLRINYSLTA